MASNNLNEAQKTAVLHLDGPILIAAGAGSGKTRVLTHRVAHLIASGISPDKILAVTFTNKAAGEMKERILKLLQATSYKLQANLPWIGTFHALGAWILRREAKTLGFKKDFSILDEEDSVSLIKESIKDLEIDPKQFQPSKIKRIISAKKCDLVKADDFTSDAKDYFSRNLALIWNSYEQKLRSSNCLDFDDLLVKTSELFSTHPQTLEKYQTRWQYINIDEYQDTDCVQDGLSNMLAAKHSNICVVGDIDQCLPAGTMVTMADGNKRPIEDIKTGDHVLSNYGSGDIRPAKVIRTNKQIPKNGLVRITTEKNRVVASTPQHIHFAEYRLGISPQIYFNYLMHKKECGWRIGTTQVYTKGQKKTVVGYLQRCNQEHADELWIISTHKTPNEARAHEYFLSLKYQIPLIPFVARKGGGRKGYVHDQAAIDKIFSSFNTELSAEKLLNDLGLSRNHPHHRSQTRNANRRNVTITLCADRRGKTPMHLIAVFGDDASGKKTLESLGFAVRPAKKNNSKSWRFETVYAEYKKILLLADRVLSVFPEAFVKFKARLGNKTSNIAGANSLAHIPASNIMPGMALFNEEGGYDTVKGVEKIRSTNKCVYDLDVEKTHNFIANGVFTHNSIYSFRGADFRNILNFEKTYPKAKIITLEENYRSTKPILEAANAVILKNLQRLPKNLFTKKEGGEKLALFGAENEDSEAAFIASKAKNFILLGVNPAEIAVLFRTNAQSRVLEEKFLAEGIPYYVVGIKFYSRKEIKDILAYIKAALNPDDLLSKKRIINQPARGIGKALMAKYLAKEKLAPNENVKISVFENILEKIRSAAGKMAASRATMSAIEESGYLSLFDPASEEETMRLANIKELVSLSKRFDNLKSPEGLIKMLEEASLMSAEDSAGSKKNRLPLTTIHAAKGLEFDYVFISGLEDGLFPHATLAGEDEKARLEEERRLFYVALTRARKKIFLTLAFFRTIFGEKTVNMPSRFLEDIPPELLEKADEEKIIEI